MTLGEIAYVGAVGAMVIGSVGTLLMMIGFIAVDSYFRKHGR